jgi:hypothetical protein
MCCVIAVVLIWRGGGGKVRVDVVIVLIARCGDEDRESMLCRYGVQCAWGDRLSDRIYRQLESTVRMSSSSSWYNDAPVCIESGPSIHVMDRVGW